MNGVINHFRPSVWWLHVYHSYFEQKKKKRNDFEFTHFNSFKLSPKGPTIGEYIHSTNSEMAYILSGNGKHICDGKEELLRKGVCAYCPKGSKHCINKGDEDIVIFTVVPEQ